MLVVAEPDFKSAAEDVQELLAFVYVGFAAPAARLDTKEMRLHDRVAPGEQLHAHAIFGLQNFSMRRPDQPAVLTGSLEQRQNICSLETPDAPQGGNGPAHLASVESAEKADGDCRRASHMRE